MLLILCYVQRRRPYTICTGFPSLHHSNQMQVFYFPCFAGRVAPWYIDAGGFEAAQYCFRGVF